MLARFNLGRRQNPSLLQSSGPPLDEQHSVNFAHLREPAGFFKPSAALVKEDNVVSGVCGFFNDEEASSRAKNGSTAEKTDGPGKSQGQEDAEPATLAA
jgi:hypothetical protein